MQAYHWVSIDTYQSINTWPTIDLVSIKLWLRHWSSVNRVLPKPLSKTSIKRLIECQSRCQSRVSIDNQPQMSLVHRIYVITKCDTSLEYVVEFTDNRRVYNCLYSHYLSAWQCMKIQRRNLTFTIMTPPSRYLQMALHWAAWVKATPSQRQTFYKETIWDPEKRG